MASPALPERSTYRTVALLQQSDKTKLERLASAQNISSGEVIRRLIRKGEAVFRNEQEEQVIEAALKIISKAVSEANESMIHTMEELDKLHLELSQREIP